MTPPTALTDERLDEHVPSQKTLAELINSDDRYWSEQESFDAKCLLNELYQRRISDVTARATIAAQGERLQTKVNAWMLECFGAEIAADKTERNHRFLEESLELVQAAGCSRNEAMQLVDYVYGRPVGELSQEVGGVMVTLAALCTSHGIDMHACALTEVARVWTKIEQIRAKQAGKPKHSPLPAQPERRKHEQRVIGHANGRQEYLNECVCGKPWPCPDCTQPERRGVACDHLGCTVNAVTGNNWGECTRCGQRVQFAMDLCAPALSEAEREACEAGANSLLVEQTRFQERARRQRNEADSRLAEVVGEQSATLRNLASRGRG